MRQFNSLLTTAQAVYPSRPDIGALEVYEREGSLNAQAFTEVVRRFRAALELRTFGSP